MPSARDVLGPGSPLSRALPGWEHREGQLAMAEAVERALTDESHLFVEAGTGTGKTLAYLVPAVLSGRKVIVSTATKALQEQIFVKDLPLVAEALGAYGVKVKAAMMKGLANYVCLRRFDEARASGTHVHDPDFSRIVSWLEGTETGDRTELSDLPEDAGAWREVSSSSETRIGAGCEHFDRCFVTRMRREAEEAQIVVVNHHLFLADLALRSGPRGAHASVIPAYDAVVFDEAHQLEDVATDFFGVRVSSARIDSLLRDAERSLANAKALEALKSGPVRGTLEQARDASRAFFASLALRGAAGESRRVLADDDVTPEVRAAHAALDLRLEALEAVTKARGEEALQLVGRRAGDLRDSLKDILAGKRASDDGELADQVRWLDVRSRSVSLGASPVDVGATLRTRLFDRVPSVVCTSATLATGGGFHFAKARLGAPPETGELLVESPFDFASRAALYLPDDLPEPSDPAFDGMAADRIAELVRMTGGGAFVLCTSVRAMKSLHAHLRSRLDLPLMVQGAAPKHLLLSRFRASGRSVLVATMSFWEGVDVPGWALRLVVLDKIPFAPPSDPVVAARCMRIDRDGGNGFTQYSVPSAAMTLKQGFGRLIRTQKDAGIVGILDRRIVRKGYGRALLASLPPAQRVRTLDELRRFWAGIAPLDGGLRLSAESTETALEAGPER
ncbi:MAG TPA: ATP-dependent DNA helicase [Polyangiaceae bacterium]|jgi:ATP-dependent DNA helicase DinG